MSQVPADTTLLLSLLKMAQNHPVSMELKNGETYNRHLVSCDNWMNTNLREVICMSRDRDKFWWVPECYIHGSILDKIVDTVKEEVVAKGRGCGACSSRSSRKAKAWGVVGSVFGGWGRGRT